MAKKNHKREGIIQLFKEADVPSTVVAPRATKADRKALLLEAIRESDPSRLGDLKDEMAGFMQLVLRPLGETTILSDENKAHLVKVALQRRDIWDLVEVVWDEIKRVTFEHLDASYEKDGEESPASLNGTIEVPELGFKLCREGAGFTDPVIDEEILAEVLGDRVHQVYDQVTIPELVIPEHTEQQLNVEALIELAKADPALLEEIRPALIGGELKSAKLNLRNIPAPE